jgi:hypothetical protein
MNEDKNINSSKKRNDHLSGNSKEVQGVRRKAATEDE